MAEKGQLWSLKNDGGHVLGSRDFRGIFPIDATNIPSDITIQVPDRDNFLKPPDQSSVEKTDEQYQKEKELFAQILTMARKQSGGTQDSSHTDAANTEQDIKNNLIAQKEKENAEAELRLSMDPIKEYTNRWNKKVQEDDRHILTLLTQLPQLIGETQDDPKKFFNHLGNHGVNSIMGIANTAWKILPDNNSQNRAIVGDVLGNLGLYMMGARNKATKRFLDPKSRLAGTKQMTGLAVSGAAGSGSVFAAYEAMTNAVRALKDIPDPENHPNRDVQQLHHMRTNLWWTAGAGALGPAAKYLKKGLSHAYGVANKTSTDLFWKAAQEGLPIGIAQASQPKWWVKGYASVIGVFPFVGTPFRVQKGKLSWLTDQKVVNTFNELGPVVHMAKLGLLTTEHARARFGAYARMNSVLYDNFYTQAKALDAKIVDGFIPTQEIRLLSEGFREKLKQEQRILRTGEQVGGQPLGEFEQLLHRYADEGEFWTAGQFRGAQKEFNQKWREYERNYAIGKEDPIAAHAAEFKEALENSLNRVDGWRTAGLNKQDIAMMQSVKNSLTDANTHFATFADTFKSPLAKHITLADENIFTAGALKKAGWVYDDQIANDLFKAFLNGEVRSSQALKDLRTLVGPATFKKYSRKYMEDIYNNSAEVYQFSWGGKLLPGSRGTTISKEEYVRKQLGFSQSDIRNVDGSYTDAFNRVQMPKYKVAGAKEAAEEVVEAGGKVTGHNSYEIRAINPERWERNLFGSSGENVDFLKNFYKEMGHSAKEADSAIDSLRNIIEIAKANNSVKIGDTAQFVKRRAVLAGAAGITGAFLASSMGDPLTGVAMALLARYGSNILTKPAALKAMVTVANPEYKDKMRRNSYLRLIRLAFDDQNPVPEGMTMDDFRDPSKALDFLMGKTFATHEDGEEISQAEVQPQPVDTAARTVAPNIPEKKVSNNVSAEVNSRMASNFIRQKGVPGSTTLNQNQRAALAGGNLYSAIAAAKHGGAVYNDGIMNLANRRRA
jgi:hypothetical protein